MDASDAVPDFPILSESSLRSLTFGVYQVKDGGYDIFVGKTMPNIIQGKIQSRHVSSKSYYLWIQFDTEDEDDPIKFWYCQCKSGARLVGSCAPVASLLRYIGIHRHSKTPLNPQIMLENVIDCNMSSDTCTDDEFSSSESSCMESSSDSE